MKSQITFEFERIHIDKLTTFQNMVFFFLVGKIAAYEHDPLSSNEVIAKIIKSDNGVVFKFTNIKLKVLKQCILSLPEYFQDMLRQAFVELNDENSCSIYLQNLDIKISNESFAVIGWQNKSN